MSNLSEFLLARIDEQEAALDNCQDWMECHPTAGCPAHGATGDRREQLNAVRELVWAWERAYESAGSYPGTDAGIEQGLDEALAYLAAPYGRHPDYRQEWKP